MENSLLNNWFKIVIVIILIIFCEIAYKYLNLNTQRNITLEEGKCREAGVKIDAEISEKNFKASMNPPYKLSTYPINTAYSYNNKLHTCLAYYNYNFDHTTPTDIYSWSLGVGVLDVYNDKQLIRCDSTGNKLPDEVDSITENVDGFSFTKSDKVTKFKSGEDSKYWNSCDQKINDLMGKNVATHT